MLPALTAALVGVVTAGAATLMANAENASVADHDRVNLAVEDPTNSGRLDRPQLPIGEVTPAPPDPTSEEPTETEEPPTSTDEPAPPSETGSSTTTPASPSPPTVTPDPADEALEKQVVAIANAHRLQAGCEQLEIDGRLTQAALGHSVDMATRDYFDHSTPEGVTFATRIVTAGFPSPGAENIARGQRTAAQVMESWMDSDGHRANILNCELTSIGVGLDRDGWFWTQDFGF